MNEDNQQDFSKGASLESNQSSTEESAADPKNNVAKKGHSRLIHFANIYLFAFLAIILIALIVIYFVTRDENNPSQVSSGQKLSQESIDELIDNENQLGDVSQTLTIEAGTTFNGKVFIKDSLDVAGSINVGGPLTLPGITVDGSSAFEDIEVSNNLAIFGDARLQGTLNVESGLNVKGDAAITGSLSASKIVADSIEFSGDLYTTRHINTGGPAPGVSTGVSAGAGGTTSISGTDTSGTVTINTGGNPSTGTLANVAFAASYGATPRVIVTPIGPSSASLQYYVTRSSSGFSIGIISSAASSSTYVFDYWVSE